MNSFNDQLAKAVAERYGFTIFTKTNVRNIARYEFIKPYAGTRSPYRTGRHDRNPCRELPSEYTLVVDIEDGCIKIHRDDLQFDLSDPLLMDYLDIVFSDLRRLQCLIDEYNNNEGFTNWLSQDIIEQARQNNASRRDSSPHRGEPAEA